MSNRVHQGEIRNNLIKCAETMKGGGLVQKYRKLSFVKLSPSENTTVLITDYINPDNYIEIARKLISYTYLNAEQLGFIEKPFKKESVLRLEMPAGEFCGDGTLAAAALARWNKYTNVEEFTIESSGLDVPVLCKVKKLASNVYKVKASMPTEYKLDNYITTHKNRKITGKLVSLPGITHLIIEEKQRKYESAFIEGLIKQITSEVNANAIGIIPYYRISKGLAMEPCVYVPKMEKLLFERGCGSGTLALGIYFAHKNRKSIKTSVQQPGGIINVEIELYNSDNNIKVKDAFLETDIIITCEGKAYI